MMCFSISLFHTLTDSSLYGLCVTEREFLTSNFFFRDIVKREDMGWQRRKTLNGPAKQDGKQRSVSQDVWGLCGLHPKHSAAGSPLTGHFFPPPFIILSFAFLPAINPSIFCTGGLSWIMFFKAPTSTVNRQYEPTTRAGSVFHIY